MAESNVAQESAVNSFTDRRVFLVPHDRAEPGLPLDKIRSTQHCDGPTYIHVGVGLSDMQLESIWEKRERFPMITLEQLRIVRDQKASQLQVFSDRTTFLVRGKGQRCGSFWETDATDLQSSSPTYIVIGCNAPNLELIRLSRRYGFSLKDLKAFRDGNDVQAKKHSSVVQPLPLNLVQQEKV